MSSRSDVSSRFPLVVVVVSLLTCCRSSPLPGLTQDRSAALPPGAIQTLRLCSRPTPAFDGSWKLSDTEVAQLERDLPRLSGMRAKGCCLQGARVGDIDLYYRQYIGVTIAGRRHVYINAFPITAFERWPSDMTLPNWKRDVYDVCDGGSHWGVLYDLTTRRFLQLSFNGIG